MEELQRDGFVAKVGDMAKQVIIKSIVCDAPARSFLKNIKGHNSLNGCERCVAVGSFADNRTTFSSSACFNADKRCHDKFVNLEYLGSHQNGPTPLTRIVTDCVGVCALDYMHLVCLGAVRRMLQFWKKGDRIVRLSSAQILLISERLVALRSLHPQRVCQTSSLLSGA